MRLNDIPLLTQDEINRLFYFYRYDGTTREITLPDKTTLAVTLEVSLPIISEPLYSQCGHIVVLKFHSKDGTTHTRTPIPDDEADAEEFLQKKLTQIANAGT